MGIPFSESELQIVGSNPPGRRTPVIYDYAYPVTEREAVQAFYQGKPIWQIIGTEFKSFVPRIIPDNPARGQVFDYKPFDPVTEGGGLDMFGVQWIYDANATGSMEAEDSMFMDDVNDWPELVQFPDVDSWDWEESAALNKEYLDTDKFVKTTLFTGWFERLISFMGFEDAAVAMIDEEQTDALGKLYMALTDTYIDIVDHMIEYYDHIDGFYVHDDWGSQMAPFFSVEAVRELIVPAQKKLNDHIHARGCYSECHSCGCIAPMVPNMIAAGFDSWEPQTMNDDRAIYEKWGKELAIPVRTESFAKDATEEEMRAAAREYVDTFCKRPGYKSWFSKYNGGMLEPAFREELYVQSRKAYAEMY